MTSIDLLALAILAISILVGLLRGFTRELFSLGALLLAVLAARALSPWLAPRLPGLGEAGLGYAAAIAIIFVLVLLLAGLAGMLMGSAVRLAGLGGYDKLLGGLFGLARGVVVLVLLTLLAGLTAMPRTTAWQASWLHSGLEAMAMGCKPWLPAELADLIQYPRPAVRPRTGKVPRQDVFFD
jgi:membrane protein required for colicin V production